VPIEQQQHPAAGVIGQGREVVEDGGLIQSVNPD
jgi:hypothetical protein